MSSPHRQLDTMEDFHGAVIQHGRLSDRIYLMKVGQAHPEELIPALAELAAREDYTKIFAKVPAHVAAPFLEAGYRQEAKVPLFYNGREDGLFLADYLGEERGSEVESDKLGEIVNLARSKSGEGVTGELLANAALCLCGPEDTAAMSEIYQTVFASYPFPIDDPAYLEETMRSHVVYFGVKVAGQWVALSSAEMDEAHANVEMTDFATLPDWRGHGFAAHLLAEMETAMKERGIKTSFTIARAVSPGMNITFAKLDYEFGGRLVNNTNIAGRIESMNIWHKPLTP